MTQKEQVGTKEVLVLMMVAYLFSITVRMIWVYQFHAEPAFYWNGQLMINTNDGYFFASGAQKELFGMHADNPRIPQMWSYGTVALTVLLTKITPFSLETIMLYLPAVISSMVVIPIILIARLFNLTLWGFLAAVLGAVTWSYYNRTMVGYYDTDMFSAMAPMFILYFLMKSTMDVTLRSALYAALAIAIYPFLYDSGASIVNAMGILYALYLFYYHRHEETAYASIILVFLSLTPFGIPDPYSYLLKIIVLIAVYRYLTQKHLSEKQSLILIGILFLSFMYFGNVFGLILSKIAFYTSSGTAHEGLHFYSVTQTIREAGHIPFSVFANRISGSQVGLIMAMVGYVALVVRYRVFLLALPLVGIGFFAFFGGLRFTVYAVPVAALSAVYLFHLLVQYVSDKRGIYVFGMGMLTLAMLYPNIVHIIEYRVPTVMNKAEVRDLDMLRKFAKPQDYTLAWWDYGYPIWFYSNTNTLTDGAKHNNDNFIISKIMQTTSPQLAANLARLSVETYVSSGYKTVANTLFQNGRKNQVDPNELLESLKQDDYPLPHKTRDIYLYLPYRMLNIFPTVAVFGNLDLTTGKKLRDFVFAPARVVKNENGVLVLSNRVIFDANNGTIDFGSEKHTASKLVVASMTKEGRMNVQAQRYGFAGRYTALYMQNYRQFIIMDNETFKSMYVQMFLLGIYDETLFEPVVLSPYTRIYRLKR